MVQHPGTRTDISQDIISEYEKFDTGELHAPSEDVILRLQEHCFSLWMEDETVDISPHLTKERAGEEKILEIRLPRTQSSRMPILLVFRKSDHELRIVSVTKDEQNEFFFEAESKEFSMHHTRFIPLYAVPNSVSSTSTNNVLLVNSQGQSLQSYSFDCSKDVEDFQRAVTGYQVGTTLSVPNHPPSPTIHQLTTLKRQRILEHLPGNPSRHRYHPNLARQTPRPNATPQHLE